MNDPNQKVGGWAHFKGLLDDPEKMQALQSNPVFNMGMGLLASRYDDSINPFQAAMGGLGNAGKAKNLMEDRANDKADRERNAMLRRDLSALIARMYAQGQGQQLRAPMMGAMNQPQPGLLGY